MYGDFSVTGDFHQMQDTIAHVKQAFEVLPADVRSRFKNDPARLVEFLADPANDEAAIEMGFREAPEPPPLTEAEKLENKKPLPVKPAETPAPAAPVPGPGA